MNEFDLLKITESLIGAEVERPNKSTNGSLSGHAAGEPFEKLVYNRLKTAWPSCVYKQYEYLNDIYLRHPKHITVEQRHALFDSPTALFLLSRSDTSTRAWDVNNIFKEKQNDTADILYYKDGAYNLIDVKTRNISKHAMPPNIISAYKLAKTCATMIDNDDFDVIGIEYIEIDWEENGDNLRCVNTHHADLFKAHPGELYINWAAALQIQFHVCELDQSWTGTKEQWARVYLKVFVESAEKRCQYMHEHYIAPFLKYIER